MTVATVTRRGTSNKNERGSTTARRSRRAWMLLTYAANVEGFCRCYRCGVLLYNPDQFSEPDADWRTDERVAPLTIDRIVPGVHGGTYRRNNIRPACGQCNSETGGALASKGRKK